MHNNDKLLVISLLLITYNSNYAQLVYASPHYIAYIELLKNGQF